MSTDPWRFQRWAFNTPTGSPARKAVLSFLAMTADCNTGRCEAKAKTIAVGTELGERTVRTHLQELEAAYVLDRRPQYRHDGGRRGDEYLLRAPGVTEWPDGTPLRELPEAPLREPHAPPAADVEAPSPPVAAQEQPIEQPPRNDVVEDACACARLVEIDLSHASRRFASAWPMEQAEVRMLIEAESAEVQEQAVDWLLSQYRTWETRGIVWALKGKVLPALRASSEPSPNQGAYLFPGRPLSAAQQRGQLAAHYAAEAAEVLRRQNGDVIEGEVIEG